MTLHLRRRMKAQTRVSVQRGSFLLEALISVLIVALGILGLIGLQARAIQNVDDAQYRAEAAYMANALLGQMWVYDRTKLVADFDTGAGGVQYTEFKAWVGQRLPGASVKPPVVTVVLRPAVIPPGPVIADVDIQVFWLAPGEPPATLPHQYRIVATVASNT
jgi:type IV pilus assembly protein PilV